MRTPPRQKPVAQPAQAANAPTPSHKPRVSPYAPAQEDPSKRGDYVAGGLFRPGEADTVPDDVPDVDAIPEPDVRSEPRARTGNKDYSVLGKRTGHEQQPLARSADDRPLPVTLPRATEAAQASAPERASICPICAAAHGRPYR